MNHLLAEGLRTLAENLEAVRLSADDLPPGVVGADDAMSLAFDAPRLIQALCNIAANLERQSATVGISDRLLAPSPIDNEMVPELPPEALAPASRRA